MTIETMRSLSRDGTVLKYTDEGSGEPALLFVHGWTCDHTHWREQVPEFSLSHRVVAVDLRGHGESDKPDQDYTIAGFVDDIAWLIRELGLDKPVVVGHSMGGVIALNLANEHPELLRAAVIADSPVVPFTGDTAGLVEGFLESLKGPGFREAASEFVGAMFFRPDSDEALRQDIMAGMDGAPQRLVLTALADTVSERNMPAGDVPVPTLYIEASTSPWSLADVKERYPNVEVAQVACSGHFLQMEVPDQFNAMLHRFLGKLP